MTRIAIIILLLGLLAASALASDSRVTKVALNHAETGTVVTIDISGQVRFSHQTEVAKNGKPYRVIVDVLSATHHLGAKVFDDMPDCIVSAVRTSQYSVKPEKVVRVVFDMKRETAYQITTEENAVRIAFPDRETPAFSSWDSRSWINSDQETAQHGRGFRAPNPAEKTLPVRDRQKPEESSTERMNKTIDNDRMVSLQSPKKAPDVQAPNRLDTALAYSSPSPPAPAKVNDLAEWDSVQLTGTARKYCDGDMYAASDGNEVDPAGAGKPIREAAELTKNKAQARPERSLAQTETKQKLVTPRTKEPPTAAKPASQKKDTRAGKSAGQSPDAPSQHVQVDASVGKTAGQDKPAPKLAQSKDQPSESDEGQIKAASSSRSTARFRRSPTMSRRLKGTMVAEFPKRLVIKYRTAGKRDPFATLINEARLKSGAMEDRIPNVDGLRLVGVIESTEGQNSALFEDSEGYGYILKAGDKVRRGYVLRVEVDRAYFQIFEYGWSRTVALNIED